LLLTDANSNDGAYAGQDERQSAEVDRRELQVSAWQELQQRGDDGCGCSPAVVEDCPLLARLAASQRRAWDGPDVQGALRRVPSVFDLLPRAGAQPR
jgi:hypothetical protein